jgi:hypothetical protein
VVRFRQYKLKQKGKKMNEVQAPLSTEERKALETQLVQGHAEISANNSADATKLGAIATGHEVHADEHGNLLLNREVQAVAHGETDANK